MNKSNAAGMIKQLGLDEIMVVAEDGTFSVQKLSPVCTFINANPGIPRACLFDAIDNFGKMPEFYQDGDFREVALSIAGVPVMVSLLFSEMATGVHDLVGEKLPSSVAEAMRALQQTIIETFGVPEALH